MEVFTRQETRFGKEIARAAKRYTPGSNAWYARLALERLFWDALQRAGDPRANQSFRRTMQRARKNYGSEFWWKPGQVTPGRLPELAAVLGN